MLFFVDKNERIRSSSSSSVFFFFFFFFNWWGCIHSSSTHKNNGICKEIVEFLTAVLYDILITVCFCFCCFLCVCACLVGWLFCLFVFLVVVACVCVFVCCCLFVVLFCFFLPLPDKQDEKIELAGFAWTLFSHLREVGGAANLGHITLFQLNKATAAAR